MSESDMAQWRAQRMAQLQQQQQGGSPVGGGSRGATAEQIEQQRRKQEAEQEQRRVLLNQIMTSEAREKLANIRLVKPERAAQVETMVINAAQSGQLEGRVTEEQLKDLLQTVTEKTQQKTSVTIMRRRRRFDDDDDDDIDNDDNW